MQAGIDTLKRDLETLENNYAITQSQLEAGEPTMYEDPVAQQELRASTIAGLKEALEVLEN